MIRITTLASVELRAIPGVQNFGAHIGQAFAADEVVGMNFGENWISVDPGVDYDETLAAVQEIVDGYPGLYRDVQTYLKERIREVLTGTSNAVVDPHLRRRSPTLRQKAAEIKRSSAASKEPSTRTSSSRPTFRRSISRSNLEGSPRTGSSRAMSAGPRPPWCRARKWATSDRDGKAYDIHVIWSPPEVRHERHQHREPDASIPRMAGRSGWPMSPRLSCQAHAQRN